MKRKLYLCALVLLTCLASADVNHLMAQEPLDGRNHILRADLFLFTQFRDQPAKLVERDGSISCG